MKAHMAEDKLYKAVYMGSGTFSITKPKRKPAKRKPKPKQLKQAEQSAELAAE